jgi:hypothetical protein
MLLVADTTLRFACSWYEGLDLDTLATLRSGALTDTDPVLNAKSQHRAYQNAHYAPTSKFIPAPPEMEDEESGGEEEDAEETAEPETVVEEPASSSHAPGSSPYDVPEAGVA